MKVGKFRPIRSASLPRMSDAIEAAIGLTEREFVEVIDAAAATMAKWRA
jgi:hypothetical protein